MFFSGTAPGPPFSRFFFQHYGKTRDFWTPFRNPLDPKTSKKVSEKETPAMLYDQMLKRGEELS